MTVSTFIVISALLSAKENHSTVRDNVSVRIAKTHKAANQQAGNKYRKAAEDGDAMAQYNPGTCYLIGNGVKKDFAEAVKWYRKAADQKHAEAQNDLGVCYYNGDGIEKDHSKAVKWYRKSAEQ